MSTTSCRVICYSSDEIDAVIDDHRSDGWELVGVEPFGTFHKYPHRYGVDFRREERDELGNPVPHPEGMAGLVRRIEPTTVPMQQFDLAKDAVLRRLLDRWEVSKVAGQWYRNGWTEPMSYAEVAVVRSFEP